MNLHDVIIWDDGDSSVNDIVVYKHPTRDFNDKTELVVQPSQVAILVAEGGYASAPFTEGRHVLDVAKVPFLTNFANKLVRGGQNPYTATIFYINKIYMNDLLWGTPQKVPMEDPVEGVNVNVGANGLMGAHIDEYNAQKFITKVVGTRESYSKAELAQYLRGEIGLKVSDLLAKTMIEGAIGILTVNTRLQELSDTMFAKLTPIFQEYGILLDRFNFNAIRVSDDELKVINDAKIAKRKKELEAKANAQAMDIESEALARKRQREGYSYQDERRFDVLGTAASNEGTSGAFMGAGMGLGMGVGMGSAFGAGMQNMAQGAFQGQPMGMGQMTPPPIQPAFFFVAVNGQSTGPYDLNVLSQMVANGTFTPASMVWKQGMANWMQAGMVPELQMLFNVPPVPGATPPVPPVPPTI